MPDVDLIVIGAGMAGINAAGRAAEAGLRVAVIERERVGGTCPLRGCIPSKALIRSAEVAHEARGAGAYGVRVGSVEIDMAAVAGRVRAIIDKGAEGARSYLESLDTVRVVDGEAAFVAPGEVVVNGDRLSARRVVISTGNHPVDPPIPGLAEVPHLDSTSALALREVPERLLVLGAGPVGLELGQALGRLGSRVTIVEATERLLPGHEPEVADVLRELLEGEGLELVLGAKVERAETGPVGRPRLVLAGERALEGDALLVAVGRRASVEALRLEEAGVEGSGRGIPVDRRLETSARGHFAAGDVLGPPYGAFTHVARRQGREAVGNAFSLDPHDVDPDFGPRAIFTDPELASIGITEREARERVADVGVGTSEFSGGKARAWGQERGLVKVVADRASRRILGAQVLAYHAADLIHPVAVTIQAGSADPLLASYHVHPTLGETVQRAVASALS